MQVLKAFFSIVKSKKGIYILYFMIFIILAVMMSEEQASGSGNRVFKETSVNLAIIDRDQSQLSRAVCAYMGEKHKLVEIEESRSKIAEALFNQTVQVALEIPEGFSESVTGGRKGEKEIAIYAVDDYINNVFITMQLNQYIAAYTNYMLAGMSEKESLDKARDIMEMETRVDYAEEEEKNGNGGMHYFFLFLPYVFICMFVIGLGGTLFSFHKPVLEKRMQCSAMPFLQRNIALFSASILLCLLFYALFMLSGCILYADTFFTKQGGYYALNAIVFVVVAVSITYLASFLTKSDSALTMVGNVLGLGMSFLGGVMVSQDIMSKEVLQVAQFLPTYWYVKAAEIVNGKMDGALQLYEYYHCLAIQGLFAIAIFAAALLCSRMKQVNS